VTQDVDQKRRSLTPRRSLFEMARFTFFSGLLFSLAWLASTGRVAYVLIMLLIAAALAYAVLDLLDYEIAKKKRRG
jgi:hypothetical protein